MSPLELIRRMATEVKRFRPMDLSHADRALFRKVMDKSAGEKKRLDELELRMRKKVLDAWNDEQRGKLEEAANALEYKAARYGKLDEAATSIYNAGRKYMEDEDLRALMLPPTSSGELPRGLATYYPPGRYLNDPITGDATVLELLGTAPDAPGAGRVLLRQTGLSSPSNPMAWYSAGYPQTMGFYESRGARHIPREKIPRESMMWSEYDTPVFKIDRGDMIKEAKGGLVRYKERRA